MKKSMFFVAVAVAALALSAAAEAATVSVTIELNPAAPGCVGCTLSGAGTYNVFATASAADNEGIAGYGISIQNVTTVLHRSPRVNSSEDSEGNINPAGFTLLRSANNTVPNGTGFLIGAGQDTVTPTPYIVHGFGQTPGSWAGILPPGNTNTGIIQPSWNAKLLLAEGAYNPNGPAPFIDFSNVDVFANVFSGSAVLKAELNGGGPTVDAPIVDPLNLVNPANCANCTVGGTVMLNPASDPADSWSPTLSNFSYTPAFGAPANAPGLAIAPTWNPATQAFSWDTGGSTRGIYTWDVSATNAGGSGVGTITVEQHYVPEPATFALLGLALVGFAGFRRK